MQNRTTTGAELRTLIHEIGHVFGAKDHYYTGEKIDPQNNKHSTHTIMAANSGLIFSEYCMYGEERGSNMVKDGMILCPGCKHFIQAGSDRFDEEV